MRITLELDTDKMTQHDIDCVVDRVMTMNNTSAYTMHGTIEIQELIKE